MESLTLADALMAEVAANMIAITEDETHKIVQPPSGPMSEVGHYHQLAKRGLKSKELDALQRVLDEVAFNVAAMIFALLDGKLEGEEGPLPLLVVNPSSREPLAASLHDAFLAIWQEEDGQPSSTV